MTQKSSLQGWIDITIQGEPFERGFQHGHLLAHHFKHIKHVLTFIIKNDFKKTLTEYEKDCAKLITPNIVKYYPEFLEEIKGISKGAKVSVDFLIAWNSLLSMYSYYDTLHKDAGQRCSAFIACGKATKDGKIVMAHNTHSDYATGPLANIVMRIIPTTGHSFVMQTYAGYIASATDWFLCDTGIIGCETTISDTKYEPQFGTPYFCRIREAMQYGESLDEYAKIMLKNNAGDYACSWLFGDINTNQIMICEIGLNKSHIETTKDGIFYGMNSAMDFELRSLETNDRTIGDLSESAGARNARLNALLTDKYYGKIDINIAKHIISDHYDANINKNVPSSLTICKHTDLDPGAKRPFYPWGCVDGKVTDSSMAQTLEFFGRQGPACGKEFTAKKFLKSHPEYAKWRSVLRDMPTYKWVKL
uniref:Peptidase C45 n=1 Tax=viral metagenome TaxID=1070528 RepID=A0A6C0HHW0_9ZZZZ